MEFNIKLSRKEVEALLYILGDIQDRIQNPDKDFSVEPEFCEYEYRSEDDILKSVGILEDVIMHQAETQQTEMISERVKASNE